MGIAVSHSTFVTNRMARKPPKRTPQRKTSHQTAGAAGRRGAAPRHKPDARIDKAQQAWAARQYDEAIWFYERALDRDPTNAVLLVDVARAYALRFRYADAGKLINKAQSLFAENARVQTMLGRSYVLLQQFDRAIACFRRALELEPELADRPKILLELARMHERLHHLDAAREEAEESLRIDPAFDKAQYVLATIDRRRGDPEAAESRWKQLVGSSRAPQDVVADSWYELASLHDKAKNFDEAFNDLLHAKQILSKASAHHDYYAQKIAAVGGRTFATVNSDYLQRWHAAVTELEPLPGRLALLTSHPRSGTTLLEQVVDSHPQVISADELQVMAEMVYVPLGDHAADNESVTSKLDRCSAEELSRVRQDYWRSMEGALLEPIGERLLLDKNPELTMLLPLVARAFPEMKVVFALRDPRDVVLSCFMQRLPLNAVSVHYLTLKGTAEKYATTMKAWLKIREILPNPWIEVRYEDTVLSLEAQARRALEFLELPWDDAVLEYHQRAQRKHVHSPTYEAVTKPLYSSSIGRWKNYRKQFEPVLEILEPFIREFGYEPS